MTFIGSATAPISPKPGRFELYSATGLRCYGTYNQWDYNLTIRVPFYVSDGISRYWEPGGHHRSDSGSEEDSRKAESAFMASALLDMVFEAKADSRRNATIAATIAAKL
jgi:hypothetical protein